jgi:hypothetical protein
MFHAKTQAEHALLDDRDRIDCPEVTVQSSSDLKPPCVKKDALIVVPHCSDGSWQSSDFNTKT